MARLTRFLVLVGLLCTSTAAMALPIIPLVAAWIGASQLVVTAISLAVSIFTSASAKKKAKRAAQRAAEQEAASLRDRTATIISSEAPWATVYGSPAPIGGSPVAVLASGDNDQFKHIVLVLASHPCEAVDEVYISGEPLALDENGYSTHKDYQLETTGERRSTEVDFVMVERAGTGDAGMPFAFASIGGYDGLNPEVLAIVGEGGEDLAGVLQFSASGFEGASLTGPVSAVGTRGTVTIEADGPGSAIRITKHLSPGGVDVADAKLMAACPDKWTADHKLSGFTYLVITLNLNLEQFQGGLPEFTAKLRGKLVPDPRTGLTAYSRNNALCLADFLRSEVGYRAGEEQVDRDALIAAANACDLQVYNAGTANADKPSYGGTMMYACDGMFRSDSDRESTRQQIEDSMAGFSLESGGVWRILAGSWTTPVMELGDADMLAPSVVVQTCNTGTQRFNSARGTYVNAAKLGVTEDFKPYANPTFLAADEKEKLLDLTLAFTGHHVRTHQLARTKVEQSRGGFVLQISPKMSAWWLRPGDRILFSSALFGFANKPFRVQDWTYSRTSPLSLQITEDEEAFYDLADETRADASPNTNLQNPFEKPAPPVGLTVESGPDHMLQQGATLVARTLVSWVQCTDSRVLRSGAVRVQWVSDGDDAGEWKNSELLGDAVSLYLTDLDLDKGVKVRVRFETPYAVSSWTYSSHMVDGVGTPGAVMGLEVNVDEAGVQARWSEPTGLDVFNWGSTHVREGTTWADATELFAGQVLTANLGWLKQGPRRIWAAHYTVDGKTGDLANVVVQINAPASPLITGRRSYTAMRLAWQNCRTTQPIDCYEVSKGGTFEGAALLGRTASNHFDVTGITEGTHRVWVVAIDLAGNKSGPALFDFDGRLDIDEVIADMEGRITGTELAADLLARIEDIPDMEELNQAIDDMNAALEKVNDQVKDTQDHLAATVIDAMLSADDALAASTTRAKTEMGEAVAAIADVETKSATATEALAATMSVVAAELDDAKAAIVETKTAQATADSATAAYKLVVATRFGANEAAAVEDRIAWTTADAARATQISGLTATVNGNYAAQTTRIDALVNADAAQVTRVDALTTTVGNNNASHISSISALTTKTNAQADQITGLTSTVAGNNATLGSRITTVANESAATASALSTLTATVGANAALAATKTQTSADIDAAKASVLSTLRAETSSAVASLQSATQVTATVNSAITSNNTVLRSEIGGVSAAAQLAYNTAASLSGNVSSSAMLRTEVLSNGQRYAAGIAVGVSANSAGVVQSQVLVNAWTFGIINTQEGNGNVTVPFAVDNGVTYIKAAVIKDADIGTLKIAGEAVTVPATDTASGRHPSIDLYISTPCKIYVHVLVSYPEQGSPLPSFSGLKCRQTGQTFGMAVNSPTIKYTDSPEGGSNTYLSTTHAIGVFDCTFTGFCSIDCVDAYNLAGIKGVMLIQMAKR